jgi:bifunctional ADP-heptose synthase (sugar kinase/adenylyltransferase)
MLAVGTGLEEATHIANAAAGVKVTKFGATVVHPDELAAALS